MMQIGMWRILFSLTFNVINETKHYKSLGIAPYIRLQPLKSSVFKQHYRLLKLSGNFCSLGQL